METHGPFEGFHYVKDLDIDKYSVIVAVGGDGTVHEVVNGLLYRKDKKKIPIAILPNGTGNDMCGALAIESFEQGM